MDSQIEMKHKIDKEKFRDYFFVTFKIPIINEYRVTNFTTDGRLVKAKNTEEALAKFQKYALDAQLTCQDIYVVDIFESINNQNKVLENDGDNEVNINYYAEKNLL